MPRKLDDIVKALKKKHPDWPESRVWATAQKVYKGIGGGMPGSRKATAMPAKKGKKK